MFIGTLPFPVFKFMVDKEGMLGEGDCLIMCITYTKGGSLPIVEGGDPVEVRVTTDDELSIHEFTVWP